jgi:hypothetical protein
MNPRLVDLSVPIQPPDAGPPVKIARASAGWCRAAPVFGLEN